jgi:hypothetical protein
MKTRTALVIHRNAPQLKHLCCFTCKRPFAYGDLVIVSEVTERGDGYAVAFHAKCAPQAVVDELKRNEICGA